MKGYKGFNNKLQCNPNDTPFQYEVGKEYETDNAILCRKGFHFCENPLDVFNYYAPANSRYCEVEGSGEIVKNDGGDTKVAASKIKIGAEIGLQDLIAAGVKFILEKATWKTISNDENQSVATNTGDQSAATNTGNQSVAINTGYQSVATNTGNWSAATNTGYRSAATNTGYRSAATNTGDRSVATNTGNQSVATNTGDRSAATNTGNWSAATNTGDRSAATNTGDRSVATNTGDRSAATNTGNQSAATNTGYQSVATNTGNWSVATNTGYRSAATVGGEESVAISLGIMGKAKGALGCWLVLAEWTSDIDGKWHKKSVQCARVDGKKIKADTFYTLKGDKFVEMEENQ